MTTKPMIFQISESDIERSSTLLPGDVGKWTCIINGCYSGFYDSRIEAVNFVELIQKDQDEQMKKLHVGQSPRMVKHTIQINFSFGSKMKIRDKIILALRSSNAQLAGEVADAMRNGDFTIKIKGEKTPVLFNYRDMVNFVIRVSGREDIDQVAAEWDALLAESEAVSK